MSGPEEPGSSGSNPKGSDDETRSSDEEMGSHQTSSALVRWDYTNDVLAAVVVASTSGMGWYNLTSTGATPRWLQLPLALGYITTVAWLFGRGAFSRAADAFERLAAKPLLDRAANKAEQAADEAEDGDKDKSGGTA